MRKVTLVIFGIFLTISTACFAQQELSMREMAIAQLYEYGEALYERGDYPESAKIFSRILKMDPQNTSAYGYAQKLNKQGQSIDLPVQNVAMNDNKVVISAAKINVPKQNFTPYRAEVVPVDIAKEQAVVMAQPKAMVPPVIVTSRIDGSGSTTTFDSFASVQTSNTNEDLKSNIEMANKSIDQLKQDISGLHNQIEQGRRDQS